MRAHALPTSAAAQLAMNTALMVVRLASIVPPRGARRCW
jgi:hypothetical protein